MILPYEDFKRDITSDDTVLLMYSGGIDSVGVLYKILTETDCNLIVHHVNLINGTGIYIAESAAISTQLQMFRNIRNFHYENSTYKFPRLNYHGHDNDITAFTAAHVLMANTKNNINHIVFGGHKPGPKQVKYKHRLAASQLIIESILYAKDLEFTVNIVYPFLNNTQRDIIDVTPDSLIASSWSCLRPKYTSRNRMVRCGECVHCKSLKRNRLFSELPGSVDPTKREMNDESN